VCPVSAIKTPSSRDQLSHEEQRHMFSNQSTGQLLVLQKLNRFQLATPFSYMGHVLTVWGCTKLQQPTVATSCTAFARFQHRNLRTSPMVSFAHDSGSTSVCAECGYPKGSPNTNSYRRNPPVPVTIATRQRLTRTKPTEKTQYTL
jgi:hypothetical protein